jgi:lia operon protein LiaF
MKSPGMLLFGIILVAMGVISLLSSLTGINAWTYCWPTGLILLGIFLLVRPRLLSSGTASEIIILGDLKRSGAWNVANEENWIGIGDAKVDLTQANIPPGETVLRFIGFIADVKVIVPAGIGVSAEVFGVIGNINLMGNKHDTFLTPLTLTTPDYANAERRIRVEATFFIPGVKVKTG